jgi:hypothetical protein
MLNPKCLRWNVTADPRRVSRTGLDSTEPTEERANEFSFFAVAKKEKKKKPFSLSLSFYYYYY